jgi:cytochrome c556
MLSRVIGRAPLLGALSLSLLASTAAFAQGGSEEGTIKYRQKVMSGVGANMGAIGDILKYGLPQTGQIAAHADLIARHADLVAAAFERDVSAGPTDAKPEIWRQPDEFREKTAAMKTEAQKLAEIAAGGNPAAIGGQMKALGDTCGGCHESFRKPKEESYKRAGSQ